MSSDTISAQALFHALVAQGVPMVMPLDESHLQQLLDYKTIKAAQRRRERRDFPPTTRIGRRIAVMLPDLAVWLTRHSASSAVPEPTPHTTQSTALPPPVRRRGRPRKHATVTSLAQGQGGKQ